MKFITLDKESGIEAMVSDREVANSRFKLVINKIINSQDWRDHVAKCPIGGKLVFINFNGNSIPINELRNFEEKILNNSRFDQTRPEEEIRKAEQVNTDEEAAKRQQTQMKMIGNELYFGIAGGRKILAGCGCGMEQNVSVMHNPSTDYVFNSISGRDQTESKGSLYSSKGVKNPDAELSTDIPRMSYFENKPGFGKKPNNGYLSTKENLY